MWGGKEGKLGVPSFDDYISSKRLILMCIILNVLAVYLTVLAVFLSPLIVRLGVVLRTSLPCRPSPHMCLTRRMQSSARWLSTSRPSLSLPFSLFPLPLTVSPPHSPTHRFPPTFPYSPFPPTFPYSPFPPHSPTPRFPPPSPPPRFPPHSPTPHSPPHIPPLTVLAVFLSPLIVRPGVVLRTSLPCRPSPHMCLTRRMQSSARWLSTSRPSLSLPFSPSSLSFPSHSPFPPRNRNVLIALRQSLSSSCPFPSPPLIVVIGIPFTILTVFLSSS